MGIFSTLGAAMTSVLGWLGDVISALLGAEGALADLWPLAMVGIAFGLVFKGISMIKSFAWGF